jgi:hypothetical protein
MAQHLSRLRTILRLGAQLAYVVGDQASYLQVMIRTGQLLADIAESLGNEVLGIDLFRTRLATANQRTTARGGCSPPMARDKTPHKEPHLARPESIRSNH